MAEGQTVRVACRHPGGVTINLAVSVADGTGGTQMRPYESVTLKGPSSAGSGTSSPAGLDSIGITEVDAKFWEEWLAVNQQNPFVTQGAIFALAD